MSAKTESPPTIDRLDAWLAEKEAGYPDIRNGLAKEIVWASRSDKAQTDVCVVYVHGFSASRGEVRPLPDIVAQSLGANLFYTRLTGHGRNGDAMAEATLSKWQDDMREALEVGARLGRKTVVIATSTGATLTTWALSQPALADNIAAAAFLSPNFRIRSRGAWLLTAPLAKLLIRGMLGQRRSFTPLNDLHAAYWTTEYPVEALLPMARLVGIARRLPYETLTVPTLFVHSPDDDVVDAAQTARVASGWGAATRLIDPPPLEDPYHHVVAGDALSPATTRPIAGSITEWFMKFT